MGAFTANVANCDSGRILDPFVSEFRMEMRKLVPRVLFFYTLISTLENEFSDFEIARIKKAQRFTLSFFILCDPGNRKI